MSADYILLNKINITEILNVAGISLDTQLPPDDTTKVITDGANYIHLYCNEEGEVNGCTRFGGNNEDAIFELLIEADIGWHAVYVG